MLEILQQFIPQLSAKERVELYNLLKAFIAKDICHTSHQHIKSCPRCGWSKIVKKGKSKDGQQRYLCKGCRQTFGPSTLSLIGQSKLKPQVWYDYALAMIDGLSLREAAKRVKVSLPTSWFMRHRICEIMGASLPDFRSDVPMQIDSTYITENFSGNYNNSLSFDLPRNIHKSGSDMRTCGISSQKICVICGINDLGDTFCEIAARGREDFDEVAQCLKYFVDTNSSVSTDGYQSYSRALKTLKVKVHHRLKSSQLSMVNALHSRLKEFLIPFHGVSTRRLQHYLDWFCWCESYKSEGLNRRDLLINHSKQTHYETTWSGYAQTPHLFMDYWFNVNSALT